MPRRQQFLHDFKQTVEFLLSQVGGVSRRDFVKLYEFDEFLQGEAQQCRTPRALAIAFAARFLARVNAAYFRVCALALVRFLARQSGRSVEDADKEAVRALAELDATDPYQLERWLDAYFRDVS
jgi:hypothetical protein